MLNNKITTCPQCGKIKSKTKPCSFCGYGDAAPVDTALELAILEVLKAKYPSEYNKIKAQLR